MKIFPYSTKQLAQILQAAFIGNSDAQVENIWIDSRHIVQAENGIFFALNGVQLNGHDFVQDAYNKGIRNFVVSVLPENNFENANFILVKDTRKALQNWAKYHRSQFDYPVIGITGSNGKTIVKEWLYQLLFNRVNLIRSPKSFNSQLGVPLSVLEMEKGLDLAIFELGISQPHEMNVIAAIAQPNLAVITNVGSAHSAFFPDRTTHIQEKIKIGKDAETIIFPYDDDALREEIKKQFPDNKLISFGTNESAVIQLLSELNDSNLVIEFKNKTYKFQLPFSDEASIINALNCFAVLTQIEQINLDEIVPNFENLHAVEMRLEIKEGNHDTVIINDAFNADLSSIPIALNVLNQQTKSQKTLVLTDILQNRQKGEDLYSEVAHWVNSYPIQKVILIGKEITAYQDKFKNLTACYQDTHQFIEHLQTSDYQNEAILFKGARKFELEHIVKIFEKKSHDTILEVNLQNLLENVNYFRSKLQPKTQLMCMVKAFGYGTGGFEVAQALSSHNVDYLGVAYADEGAELRQKGIKTPIMVMNPEQSSYDTIIDHHLEAEIYSLRVLEKFTLQLIQKKIKAAYPIHIKLNTGMNRLGLKPNEISELIQNLADNPYVKVQSIFSHLATSDVPAEHDFVHQQVATFNAMYQDIAFNLGYKPTRHILNSAGILNFPEYQMDMVRLGIGMYGIAPDDSHKKHLKTVVTFKTVISQITELQAGETISYGRKFSAKKPTRIATLPVGYADGIKRVLSNKGQVAINGKLAPIVGTVCMDMIMVDITNIACAEGDEVIIFGEKPTLDDIANQCDTISYEILTSISMRVKRIYLRE